MWKTSWKFNFYVYRDHEQTLMTLKSVLEKKWLWKRYILTTHDRQKIFFTIFYRWHLNRPPCTSMYVKKYFSTCSTFILSKSMKMISAELTRQCQNWKMNDQLFASFDSHDVKGLIVLFSRRLIEIAFNLVETQFIELAVTIVHSSDVTSGPRASC